MHTQTHVHMWRHGMQPQAHTDTHSYTDTSTEVLRPRHTGVHKHSKTDSHLHTDALGDARLTHRHLRTSCTHGTCSDTQQPRRPMHTQTHPDTWCTQAQTLAPAAQPSRCSGPPGRGPPLHAGPHLCDLSPVAAKPPWWVGTRRLDRVLVQGRPAGLGT